MVRRQGGMAVTTGRRGAGGGCRESGAEGAARSTIGNGGGETSKEEEQGTVLYAQGPLVLGEKVTRCLRRPKALGGDPPGTLGTT